MCEEDKGHETEPDRKEVGGETEKKLVKGSCSIGGRHPPKTGSETGSSATRVILSI